MNKEEASKHFCIPIEVLDEYESWGLCSEVKKVMGTWHYDDTDIERLGIIMTLHDIGFDNKEVEYYMQLEAQGEKTEAQRRRMLDAKRVQSLDEIHFKEKQIDRLDYLKHKMGTAK